MTAKLRTCLTFPRDGEEAVKFYTSLLPDSEIERIVRPDPDSPPLVIEFKLYGAPYMMLNGPDLPFGGGMSISVLTGDQAETDRLWDALTADGGSEIQCGWLKDRYGISWQIVPEAVPKLLASGGPAADRVMQAMMGMTKFDIAELESAAMAGETATASGVSHG